MIRTLILLLVGALLVRQASAQDKSSVAALLLQKLAVFRAETDSILVAPPAGYAIVLGSSELNPNDYCFNISLVTDAATLDNVFSNYYLRQEGRLVLLYLNHPSMDYLAGELGARKIDPLSLQQIRESLPQLSFFLPVIPYLVCCNQYGAVSGEIAWPGHERYTPFQPAAAPLAYPGPGAR